LILHRNFSVEAPFGINVSQEIDPRVYDAFVTNEARNRFAQMQHKVRVTMYDATYGYEDAFEPGDPINDCSDYDPQANSSDARQAYLRTREWPQGPGSFIEFESLADYNVPLPTSPKNLTCEQATATVDLSFGLEKGGLKIAFAADLIANYNPDHVSSNRGMPFAITSDNTLACDSPSFVMTSLQERLERIERRCTASGSPGGVVTPTQCYNLAGPGEPCGPAAGAHCAEGWCCGSDNVCGNSPRSCCPPIGSPWQYSDNMLKCDAP